MEVLKIWKGLGCLSLTIGLLCFALSSNYQLLFGNLGFGGHVAYQFLSLFMFCLILRDERLGVEEKYQSVVAALIFVVICLISVVHDKVVAGKSDALSIISYGSFALMSLCMSRKFELGFETGFTTFFLQLFASQLFKINSIFLLIALFFSSIIIFLYRHRSESSSISPNGYPAPEHSPLNEATHDSPGTGQVSVQSTEEGRSSFAARQDSASGQSPLPRNINQQNNQEESHEATHDSPSINGQVSLRSMEEGRSTFAATHDSARMVEVSEGSTLLLDGDNEHEEEPSSLQAESREQDQVSSAWLHSSPRRLLRWRRNRRTPGIQSRPSRLADTLGRRWPWHVAPTLLFFFSQVTTSMVFDIDCSMYFFYFVGNFFYFVGNFGQKRCPFTLFLLRNHIFFPNYTWIVCTYIFQTNC